MIATVMNLLKVKKGDYCKKTSKHLNHKRYIPRYIWQFIISILLFKEDIIDFLHASLHNISIKYNLSLEKVKKTGFLTKSDQLLQSQEADSIFKIYNSKVY